MKPLEEGARVTAGTVLGRIGKVPRKTAPHVLFEIRPAGKGAPRIDPKPILDGWKLLESTAIYRAAGRNPFVGKDAATPVRRPDPADEQGGADPARPRQPEHLDLRLRPPRRPHGPDRPPRARHARVPRRQRPQADDHVAASAATPTYTASGNVSEHSTGTAVDIAAINGITITPQTQGPGSITEVTIQRLLTLQGTMKPHQIISLMKFEGTDNTFAMGDHGDHIHVGFRPLYGTSKKGDGQVDAVLKPSQWIKLIDRLDEIENPEVSETPVALRDRGHQAGQPAPTRASSARPARHR